MMMSGQKMQRAGMCLSNFYRFGSVASCNDVVAEAMQHFTGQVAQLLIVFNEEDGLGAARHSLCLRSLAAQ